MQQSKLEKLIDTACGRADPATAEEIRREAAEPDSETMQFVRALSRAASNPLGIAGMPPLDSLECAAVDEEIDALAARASLPDDTDEAIDDSAAESDLHDALYAEAEEHDDSVGEIDVLASGEFYMYDDADEVTKVTDAAGNDGAPEPRPGSPEERQSPCGEHEDDLHLPLDLARMPLRDPLDRDAVDGEIDDEQSEPPCAEGPGPQLEHEDDLHLP